MKLSTLFVRPPVTARHVKRTYVTSPDDEPGKPTGRDQALGRPNAVAQLGESRARALLVERLDQVRSQVHALTVEPLPLLQMLDEVRALMAPILP